MSQPPELVIKDVKDAVLQIRRLYAREDSLRADIAELDTVITLLDTPAWTDQDYELVTSPHDGEPRTRLDRCHNEFYRHNIVGGDGHTARGNDLGNRLQDSPFWHCVSQAIHFVTRCLLIHQGRHSNALNVPPQVVEANAPFLDQYERMPAETCQVALAFPLVTLLYATFTIPLPPRSSPLWRSMSTYDWPHALRVDPMPSLGCLEDPRQDTHDLKANLRRDVFYVHRLRYPDMFNPRYTFNVEPVMPWRDILAELVGYTRHAHARLSKPSYCPLGEARVHCAVAKTQKEIELAGLTDRRQEVTVAMSKLLEAQDVAQDAQEPPPPHLHTSMHTPPDLKRNTRLLARIQSLMNDL
jgi:hypothetical protein